MSTKKSFIKEHKKEIIVGVSLAAAWVTCYLIFKNKEALQSAIVNFGKSKDVIKEVITLKDEVVDIDIVATKEIEKIVDVASHIRHLPEGQHPSADKIRLAIEQQIKLGENETLVKAYQKSLKKAA